MVTDETIYKVAKLIVLGLIIHVCVLAYVFYTDYRGRDAIASAAREGCKRDRISRSTNASGWRIAQAARAAEGQLLVAQKYGALAERLETAAAVDCDKSYPKASLIP